MINKIENFDDIGLQAIGDTKNKYDDDSSYYSQEEPDDIHERLSQLSLNNY
jgi:hypothetical protein